MATSAREYLDHQVENGVRSSTERDLPYRNHTNNHTNDGNTKHYRTALTFPPRAFTSTSAPLALPVN